MSHRQLAVDRPPPAGEPAETTPSTRIDTIGPKPWAALCIAAAGAVWAALYIAERVSSQFFADDFLYLQLARLGHLDVNWLKIDNYGHFAPLTRLAYLVVERRVHLDYAVAAIVPATLGMLLFLALLWLSQQLLGARPAAMLLALAGATSVPVLRVVQWWGAAVHVLGAAVCMMVCVAAFVALQRSGRWWYGAVSVAALAVGLLVQERPLLTIGYLVLIRYLFFTPRRAETVVRWLAKELALWTPYVVVVATYLVYRFFFFASEPAPGDLGQGALFTASGFERSFLPSLVGVRLGADSGWLEPAAAAGWLVLIGSIVAIALFRHSAWKCVAFLVATYLANVMIVAAGRLGVTDAVYQSRDLQYFVDTHLAAVIALMLGMGALPVRSRRAPTAAQVVRLVVPVVALAISIATAFGWSSLINGNNQTAAHRYLNEALPRLSAERTPFDLIRLRLPRDVAPDFLDPWTDQPAIFSLSPAIAQHMRLLAPRRIAVLADGIPRPVHPVPVAQVPAASLRAGSKSSSVERTPAGACITEPRRSPMTVPLPSPLHSDLLFFQITYTATKRATVQAATETSATTTSNSWRTTLPAGTNVSIVDRLDGDSADRLSLAFGARAHGLCVQSVWLGKIAAEGPEGCRVVDHEGQFTTEPADCSTDWPG